MIDAELPDPEPTDEPTQDAGVDDTLKFLLNFVLGAADENDGASIGLTLTVGGSLISGSAIARPEWVRALVEQLAEADSSKSFGGVTSTVMASVLGRHQTEQEERITDWSVSDRANAPRNYINLRDARIWSGASVTGVGYWRGALKEVQGWTLGIKN